MKRIVAVTLFLTGAVTLGWLVWIRPLKVESEDKVGDAVVPVHVGRIIRGDIHNDCTAYGTVEAGPQAYTRLAVAVPGVISAVHCVEGQIVRAGDLLFELDSRAAEIAVQFAQKTVDRQRKLAETDGTSLKALQEAEQQSAAAQAQLALLRIRSPITGTVIRLNLRAGEAADLNSVLAEVVNLDRLVVNLMVTGEDLGSLQVGQPVELIPSSSTNRWLTTLKYVGAQIDSKTGSGLVRAPLPTNSGCPLGMFLKARIEKAVHPQRLLVPVASIAKNSDGKSSIALVEGEKAILRPVQVGWREGDRVEIDGEGIRVDQVVVTEGAYGLILSRQSVTRIQVVND